MSTVQLYAWGPALGAPSIDPKCVIIEAYLRLLNIEYTVVQTNDPQASPTGELPLIKDGNVWVAGVDRILTHFSMRNQDANASLTPEQRAVYLAYNAMIQENLYDCMLYTWYADMTNFVKSIRPTYAKLLSFPGRYLVPVQLKNSAKARLAKYNVEITSDDTTLPQNEKEEMKELQRTGWHHMYKLARETYASLDAQLGSQKYMFGDSPTTLDCIVFGYLALHLYPDLPHGRLRHILTHEYPRLAEFCERFNAAYFSREHDVSTPAEDVPSLWKVLVNNPRGFFSNVKDDIVSYMGTDAPKEKSTAQIDFERKRIWSIAGGVTCLLAYIIWNGIISVEFDGEQGDFESWDEYDQEEVDEEL
ncbi:Tom37 C-terminal domain-containing protein [Radiomyces spectabilis]|uniref:Tom37 C-terminal domain-containing protein n=1 Tax=Radiomyces spectabilis TaxID=64574 RepID=UPI00221E44A2|nr:Tom37 C-terminal domain-containing protein [Radiomyces spectabilis]KAI8380879.1 Tom37 C-terminal domain-containing protein [Radiomyces spectabilis]